MTHDHLKYLALALVVALLILPLAGVASDLSGHSSAPAMREKDTGIEVLRIPEEHPGDEAVEKAPYVAPLSSPSAMLSLPRDPPSGGAVPSDKDERDLQKAMMDQPVVPVNGSALALPDLVDDGDYWNYPNKTLVRWDEPLQINCDVRNIGTVNSGGFYVDYYLSLDNTITIEDYLLGYVYISNVAPYSYADANLLIDSFHRYVPPGMYYIGYWYDSFSNVVESDETNNIAVDSTQLTVAYPNKPDLLDDGIHDGIEGLYFFLNKSSYYPNELFEVHSDVANRGPVDSGSFYVDYYLSTDRIITTSDYWIGYDYLSSVPAGYWGDSDYYGSIPGSIPAGTYYLGCIIDDPPSVNEFDETNNKAVDDSTYTIQGSIDVTAPNGNQNWTPGSAHTITWTQAGLTGTNVRILLMKDYGYNIAQIITSSVSATSGSYTWTVPMTLAGGTDYWVKIESLSYPGVYGDMFNGWITIPNLVPTITAISPTTKNSGDPGFTLNLTGTNFNPSSRIRWNGADRTTTYVTATYMSAVIPASDIASAGTATVTVFNPAPGGGTSNGVTFTISPRSLTVTAPDGNQNWIPGSAHTITWSQAGLTGTNVRILLMKDYGYNIAQIITSSVSATSGSYTWTVPMTLAGGTDYWVKMESLSYPGVYGDMYSGWITIPNLVPTITTISPTTKNAGDPAFTLTVTGTNFNPSSKVRWNGANRTTTYVSPTQVSASILNTDIAAPGTASVTVFNPAPGGGTSAAKTFTINNPVPTITAISPTTKNSGDPGFTLNLTGTNFIPSSRIRWNGADRTTTYVTATYMSAVIPASDIASAGTATVTVFNPAPGGGTSNGVTFTISPPSNPVPTLTSISPSSKAAGDPAFTLTVTGTGFSGGSKVRWNGANRTTTYVSGTSLTAAIPASDIASAGTATVTVFNPAPGGGTSNGVTFTISPPSNPVPTLTSISPSSKAAGDPAFTLTVTGTGFSGGSKVRWNGANRTTTYVSGTSLTAAIPASDIASVGTAMVTVFNPAPGGGTSAARTFTISGPTITVLAPNGGETYHLGGPLSMSWSYSGNPGSAVNIEVLREETILKVIPGIPIGSGGLGSFSVTIPASTSYVGYYRIRVTSASDPTYSDTSNGPFTIASPTLTVTMPNGGENFPLGAPLPMSWTYKGNPGATVNIEVLRSGAVLKTLTGIPTGSGGSGSYSVPMIPYGTPLGSDYTIRITSPTYANCTDTSNGPFTISGPTITVTAPNGGETYHVGSPLPMSWTYTGNPGATVNIEVLRSGAVLKTLTGIPTGAGGSGSYNVSMIPYSTPLASDYQIRVTSSSVGSCTDSSNGYFTIAPA
ncbi:MAG: Ser-Thr-rich glycosyl-phosphatidyl-inositol-anchored membrane family protein [Euryarchaeota archaeon ADurb.BinA087]|nr:MAG: Ser-Thr-rich glycosyl-phosphatidyl-inositol-anchored membrane family protein [Euryarchaeota archaeon ADurb.BinA087]